MRIIPTKQGYPKNNDIEVLMNINEIQDYIIEEMSAREDLMDKYEYIIDSGKHLDPGDGKLRNEENLIEGCQSKVWIKAEYKDKKICLFGDSDSLITKGMIALLIRVLNNQSPEDILDADLYFIYETGLRAHLSPARSDGLAAIINQIKTSVEAIVEK